MGSEYAERVRECEGAVNAVVGDGGSVVAVSAGDEYMGDKRGSGIASSADQVLEISVVHGMKGLGRVCEMCMCLARGWLGGDGGEWMRGLGLGFTMPLGTG